MVQFCLKHQPLGCRGLTLGRPLPAGIARRARRLICHSTQQDEPVISTSLLNNERFIASMTSIGISGSIAIAGSMLASVPLYSQFHFGNVEDLKLAAVFGSILAGYELLLLGLPWYSGLTTSSSSASTSSATSPSEAESEPSGTAKIAPSPFNLKIEADEDQVLSLPLLRSSLALQQACFVATATMMRADIPASVDAGLIIARESSKELLQRGLFVTFLSGWLADRCFEAGADDVMQVLGSPVYTTELCRWVVASLATLLILPPVLADAKALSLSVATNWAVMSTSGTKAGDEDGLIQEYRLYDALQRTIDAWPARLTRAAHSARGILRFSIINAVFAVTQNLAASLAISVVTNLLLLGYAVRGRQVLGLKTQRPVPKGGKPKAQKPPSLKWPPDNDRDKRE